MAPRKKEKVRLLHYLANPYSHKDHEVKLQRAYDSTEAAVRLLNADIHVFAPIPYNYHWEKFFIPGDWIFWEQFDKNFLDRCDGLIVLMLDGWDKSIGVTAEIKYAKKLKMPICYVTLEEVKSGDVSKIREMETKILEQRKSK
jgi:hypothetical protein